MTLQEILQQQEQKEGISGTSTETLEDILRRHGPAPKTPSPVVPEPTTATPAAEEPSFLQQNLDIPYALGGAATLGTLGGLPVLLLAQL